MNHTHPQPAAVTEAVGADPRLAGGLMTLAQAANHTGRPAGELAAAVADRRLAATKIGGTLYITHRALAAFEAAAAAPPETVIVPDIHAGDLFSPRESYSLQYIHQMLGVEPPAEIVREDENGRRFVLGADAILWLNSLGEDEEIDFTPEAHQLAAARRAALAASADEAAAAAAGRGAGEAEIEHLKRRAAGLRSRLAAIQAVNRDGAVTPH